MFFGTPESWIFLGVTCVVGFLIGRWIKARREKTMTRDDYVHGLKRRIQAETQAQKKKQSKKERRADRRKSGV